MEITINIDTTSPAESMAKKSYLQKIVNNLTKENLAFIAELSEKNGINEKLNSKKTLIKSFI